MKNISSPTCPAMATLTGDIISGKISADCYEPSFHLLILEPIYHLLLEILHDDRVPYANVKYRVLLILLGASGSFDSSTGQKKVK